jgi:hypothetical protein
MSKAREFIDFWTENSVHSAEQYGSPGGSQRTSDLVKRCVEMAETQGLSQADLEAEVGNLSEYVRTALDEANEAEKARNNRHRP